jgi:3-deoxy-manno-octulosonate cytidylyltransferase (CMP-KDO synthetase)
MSNGAPFIAVIPARLKSTRLPDKPLADIHGKPMVVRVAERAAKSGAGRVVVATDHADIMAACAAHQVESVLTRVDHVSGTDRLAELADQLQLSDSALLVNVQGDEPLIAPELIHSVASLLHATPSAAIATAAHGISTRAEFENPNVVKVVMNHADIALYFSRAPIPFVRDGLSGGFTAWRHIGIYGYRAAFLKRYATLGMAPAERAEALEQLRAMHYGFQIVVRRWEGPVAPGVDTPEDLARVREMWVA